MKPIDKYWSDYYAQEKDFLQLSDASIARMVSLNTDSIVRNHLDIGCGTGELVRQIAKLGYESTGVDPSSVAIKKARAIDSDYSVKFVQSDFSKFQSSALYSLITVKYVIAFIKDIDVFLEKVKSLLTDNGTLVIITPCTEDVAERLHKISLAKGILVPKLEKYFVISSYKEDIDTFFVCRKK